MAAKLVCGNNPGFCGRGVNCGMLDMGLPYNFGLLNRGGSRGHNCGFWGLWLSFS